MELRLIAHSQAEKYENEGPRIDVINAKKHDPTHAALCLAASWSSVLLLQGASEASSLSPSLALSSMEP